MLFPHEDLCCCYCCRNTKSGRLFSVGEKGRWGWKSGRTAFTGTKRKMQLRCSPYIHEIYHASRESVSPGPRAPGHVKTWSLAEAQAAFSPQGPRQADKQTQTNTNLGKPKYTGERGRPPEQKPSSGSPQGQNSWLIESTGQHIGQAAGERNWKPQPDLLFSNLSPGININYPPPPDPNCQVVWCQESPQVSQGQIRRLYLFPPHSVREDSWAVGY